MRPALHLTALACLTGATLVFAGVPIKPTMSFTEMRLVVSYVSTNELMELQREDGSHPDLRDLRQSHRNGFSRLTRNRETGALTCAIYLPNDKRPREVDDAATLTLGHELLHCMLGDYHR